jgi:Smg protein
MKEENLFDVLMYLFENYMDEESPLYTDPEKIKDQLSDAGFRHSQINKAFLWLEDLAQGHESRGEPLACHAQAMRIYSPSEMKKLDVECRGFLYYLEQIGVVDAPVRELIVDRVMALESDEIDLEQLKWVVLMVMFNQPGFEEAYSWVESLVLDELPANVQ